jgi:hypothetical protein
MLHNVLYLRCTQIWNLEGDVWRNLLVWTKTSLNQEKLQSNDINEKKTDGLEAELSDVLQSRNGATGH